MRLAGISSLVCVLVMGAGSATVFYAARPVPMLILPPLASARQIITTPLGGTVVSISVAAGERVKKGQVLLKLHAGEWEDRAGRVIESFDETPLETLERGASIVNRVPAQTWMHAISTDPDRLAAEEEYVSALAAHESAPAAATKQLLERASRKRMDVASHVVRPGIFETLVRSHRDRAKDVAWLSQQFKNGEVKAPVDGKVLIFDLRPGDEVAPNGRLMLLEAAQ